MQKRNVEDFYPLSPMQQGMYFHHQFTPGQGMYVEQLCCQLKGPMDTETFRNSWQQLINRYTILRTSFISKGLKEPLQIVHRNVGVNLQLLDWSEMDSCKIMSDISDFQTKDQLSDFDLSLPSPMRLTLIKISDGAHIFIWTYHHILLDGWSVPLLLNELFTIYRSLCKGITPELTTVRPYRDYIVWLRKQNLAEASAYWREYMRGYENQPSLFIDKLSGKLCDRDEVYDQVEFELPEAMTSELIKFAGKNSLTLNTCLQGAWALLMSRYKECNDIVFGATVSGRPTALTGAENMIGLFINTLPVRIRINGGTVVSEWLKQIQSAQVEARKYEFSSLSEIRKFYDVPSDSPVFESILVFENYSVPEMMSGIEDFEIKELGSHDETNFPLTLVAGLNEKLMLRLIYSTNRFENDYVNNMLRHVASLLSAFVKNPDQKLSSIDLLSESEREKMLSTWNNSESDFPSDECIHWQFEKQVSKSPNAIAIYHDGNHLTYHQLNKRANILAWKLKDNGIGPESLVGILMNKSIDMIVSILAVLKAGGAYVPLDPQYPAKRLQFMMSDSNIKVLITSEELVQQLPAPDCKIIYAHSPFFQSYKEREQNLKAYCEPESLAYVIYTSGSTGMPKGALLHHRGVLNFAKAYREKVGINTGSRVLQLFSFSFDGAVGDIFPALLYGGTLVLYTGNIDIQSTKLENILSDCAINIALLPPAILTSLSKSKFPELHTIVSGGEACPVETARRWSLNRCFINAYGPTEATVAALWYKVTDRKELSVTVPLGRPIANYRIYILDKDLRPVPVGIPGEICISGIGLARGYLNKPALTAECFLPNPVSTVPGDRIYKTGDLGRYLPNGNVEFLGRIDFQVKLRGFRIEPGEIESVLLNQPRITEAAVIVYEGKKGGKKLTAYYVSDNGLDINPAELRSRLKEVLPDYMIPAYFIRLDKIPLTPNFKLDKQALPVPDRNMALSSRAFIHPRDSIELKLVQIWEEILDIRPISIRDNFFELGGHSLLAIRLIGQIQEVFKLDLQLISIFKEPTIEYLAALIRDDGKNIEKNSLIIELNKGIEKEPLIFVHPSGGSVHWYTELARYIDRTYPFYGIQARGIDGKQELDESIEAMAFRYVDALLRKNLKGPFYLGGWSFGVIVAYEMAQQLSALGHEIRLLALLDHGPHIDSAEPADDAELLTSIFDRNFSMDLTALRKMSYSEQIKFAFRKAKKHKLIPFYVRLSDFRFYISILKTMRKAWHNYKIEKYSGKITLFRSTENINSSSGPSLGWDNYAGGGVEIIDVPGDHISMMFHPNVEILAGKITEKLNGSLTKTDSILNENIRGKHPIL